MVVYQRKDEFVMVEQHNHALLSGQFASEWSDEYFEGEDRKADVIMAVTDHDRAWIDLDAHPLWNDSTQEPFSFIDYPSALKLPHYKQGIDSLEAENAYAALLCSMHYASFFNESTDPREQAYLNFELNRQNRIRKRIMDVKEYECNFHFALLKFCDRLSLYICHNKPGASKENEFPSFREAIVKPGHFSFTQKPIAAHWLDEKRIGLTVFPFKKEFETSVSIRRINKNMIQQLGLVNAYKKTPITERTVVISRM
jgi:Protein of unknown function (DUF3891)